MSTTQKTTRKIRTNTLISWGASIVIVGLMFKILHWEGGEWMIGIGLAVESCLFFILGIESMVGVEETISDPQIGHQNADLDQLLSTTINHNTIEKLNRGFEQFNRTVAAVNEIAGHSQATQAMMQEVQNSTMVLQQLRKNMGDLSNLYRTQLDAANDMANYAKATRMMMEEFQSASNEMQHLRKNLADLNNVYRAQLEAFRKN